MLNKEIKIAKVEILLNQLIHDRCKPNAIVTKLNKQFAIDVVNTLESHDKTIHCNCIKSKQCEYEELVIETGHICPKQITNYY